MYTKLNCLSDVPFFVIPLYQAETAETLHTQLYLSLKNHSIILSLVFYILNHQTVTQTLIKKGNKGDSSKPKFE